MKIIDKIFMLILILGCAILYQSYKSIYPDPKFSVGDCVSEVFEADEFLPRRLSGIIYKIKSVGKHYYLHSGYLVDGYVHAEKQITPISIMNDYAKVNCNTGNEIK